MPQNSAKTKDSRATEGGPEVFEDLRTLLTQEADSLSARLRQCAEYATRNPDDMALGTVTDIAGKAGVQPSAMVRFAQALGYSGFSEMQQVFRQKLLNRWPDYQERLHSLKEGRDDASEPIRLLDSFAETAVNSLIRLREDIQHPRLEEAVSLLAKAETIYILGLRRSFPVASYLSYALSKMQLRAVLMDGAGGSLPEQTRMARENDAFLSITFNPYSKQTVEATSLAFARNVPVISISDSALSPIARVSTIALEVVEEDVGAFRSLSATFCLAMTLAVAVGYARSDL